MANEQLITVTGRLTGDPELRFTPSGSGVANFTIAFTPSKFDRNANSWKDGTTTFWRCAAWNQGKLTRAENVCDLLKKGDNVIAQGVLETRKWEDKEGNDRSSIELNIQAIGKDATFHSQPHNKPETATPAAQEDPWATPEVANAGGWPAQSSEAPF